MAAKLHENSHTEVSIIVRCGFWWLMFFAEILLFGCLGLIIYYIWPMGIAWENDKNKQLNLHYVLMLGGLVFLNGQAILVYRTFPCCKVIYNKVLHTIFFVLSISAITIGLVCAIQAHQLDASPRHFYSLHSWIGLGTMGLFALQFVVGFISYLVLLCCDTATAKFRQRLLPTHITFGLSVFTCAVVSCVTGLVQVGHLNTTLLANYRDLPEQSLVLNVLGASLIGLAILMPYMIHTNSFKRCTNLTRN